MSDNGNTFPATPVVDAMMREAIADGSYWKDGAFQDRMRGVLGQVAGDPADPGPAVVPRTDGLPSSLSPAAAADKVTLESWMADKSSSYWRGDGNMSAEQVQAHYRDLVRAEEAGQAMPLGPKHEGADPDMPFKGHPYRLDGLPIYSAQDRDIVDVALKHFEHVGFGQQRVSDVLQWALSQPHEPKVSDFKSWAVAQGWSDKHIAHGLEVYKELRGHFA
jgi:hypothetical protein